MNRGEIKLKILFEDDVCVEATYFMLFNDPNDKDELQIAITNMLYKFIKGKEETFEGAVAEVDVQDVENIYVCTYGPLSKEAIEWIREEDYPTLH